MLSEAKIEKRFVEMFGMPSEQFMRELEHELEQASPEERAEFDRLIDQTNAVLPGMNASLDRMAKNMKKMRSTMRDLRKSMSSMDDRLSRVEDTVTAMFPMVGPR